MNEFEKLDRAQRQQRLMETSMRIMEVFNDMYYSHQLNPDKIDYYGSLERLQLFAEWSKEFENKYYTEDDDAKYNTDFIELSGEFAQEKLNEYFGIKQEANNMWRVELINSIGYLLDECSIDVEELTLDDIAERNWCLADGDEIRIKKEIE